MYNVSELFKKYARSHDRMIDSKVEVGNLAFTGTEIIEFSIDDNLIGFEDFIIGTTCSSRLDLSLRTSAAIPENAKIIPYIRFLGNEGTSEWLKLGEYFIDSRSIENDVWKFVCYDKLLYGEQEFISSLTYPASMQAVWNELCGIIGVTSNANVTINSGYKFDLAPTGYTVRQVFGIIAAAHAASVKMMKNDGTIGLIKFNVNSTALDSITVSDYVKAPQTNPEKMITHIVVDNDDGDSDEIEAGTGSESNTLKITNPFITQSILNDIYSVLNGFRYIPYSMDWICFPYLEVGDTIAIDSLNNQMTWDTADITWDSANVTWDMVPQKFTSILFANKITFKGGLKATSSAPAQSTVTSEFKPKGTLTEKIQALNKTAVKQGKNYYGVSFGRDFGVKVQGSSGSEVILNGDKTTFSVDGQERFYFDPIAKDYVFDGKLTATLIKAITAVVTEQLYASLGEIARLTVDRLLTSNILNGDDTMTYIDIKGQYIVFKKSVKDTSKEQIQYKNESDEYLYWTDNTKTSMSTAITDYPVMVYQYLTSERLKIYFDENTDTFYPKIVWGEGNGKEDQQKAFMYKDDTGFVIDYIKDGGEKLSLKLGEDGVLLNGSPISAVARFL
jgi:hypothetical protein